MKDKLQFASNLTMAFLIAVVVILTIELNKAWKNERFLDATISKHTTTYNPIKK